MIERMNPRLVIALLVGLFACPLMAGTAARIIIDGVYGDWAGVPVAYVDVTGDNGSAIADIGNISIANDDEYVYLRFEINALQNLQNIVTPLRIYIDTDSSAATGWPVGDIGSDLVLMYPERYGAEQTASNYSAATLAHGTLELVSGPTVAATEFELRVKREAIFPVRGTPIFDGPDFALVIEAQSAAGTSQDWAPNGPVGLGYTLSADTLPAYEPIPLTRDDSRYVRVMTHNMLSNGLFSRTAQFTRILQAVQPDIICFQEVSSTASAVASQLDTMLPLDGGATWQAYRSSDDVVAARWPLTMMAADTVPVTGRGGQAMALVDLPNDAYGVDMYMISAHFKCCGSLDTSEDVKRQTQADANVNWFRDLREPGGTVTLPEGTPFMICGDFNLVGGPQPLDTLLTGNIINEATFGADSAPDWDGSTLADLVPLHNADAAAYTWRDDGSAFGPGRLDFVLFTDSVMTARKQFVLDTSKMIAGDLAAYGLQATDTAIASDHLPVVVDFDLNPYAVGDVNCDGVVDLFDIDAFVLALTSASDTPPFASYDAAYPDCDATLADADGSGGVDLFDIDAFVALLTGP